MSVSRVTWGPGATAITNTKLEQMQDYAEQAFLAVALTDGATIAIDWDDGPVQYVASMAGNRTFTFANPKAGGRYEIILTSDGSSRTPTMPSIVWLGGAAPGALAASKTRRIQLTYVNGIYYGTYVDQT